MKKFRKIMAVLVAAMVIMATMVPAWAAESGTGRLDDHTTTDPAHPGTDIGSITIHNVNVNEEYTVWRIFELASFDDKNVAVGQHSSNPDEEAYSYVINESSPWYHWLQGKITGTSAGAAGGTRYAKLTSDTDYPSTVGDDQLFWIEAGSVTIDGKTGYHVIYATSNFDNSYDRPTAETDAAADSSIYLDPAKAATVQRFAQAAVDWATNGAGNTLLTPALGKVFGPKKPTNSNDIVLGSSGYALNEGADLWLGYYLLGTTQGTLCSLDTTNRHVDVYDKNETPLLTGKKILKKEKNSDFDVTDIEDVGVDPDNDWVEDRDARIGETVHFRTQITMKEGAKDYVIHDVMEPGLGFKTATSTDTTLGDIVLVTLKRGENYYKLNATETLSAKTERNYTIKYLGTGENDAKDGCDFEIVIEDESFWQIEGETGSEKLVEYTYKDGDVLTVYYTAKLMPTAQHFDETETAGGSPTTIKTKDGTSIDSGLATGTTVSQVSTISNTDNRNTNYTILTYGDNSVTSAFDTATVTTFRFDLVKTNVQDHLLAGAVFELYEAADSGTSGQEINYSNTATANNKWKGTGVKFDTTTANTYIHDSNASGTVTPITTVKDAVSEIKGLDAGEYLLVETKEPTGYNKLAYPIFITIVGGNGSGTPTATEGDLNIVTKNNNNVVSNVITKEWNATAAADGTTGFYKYDTTTEGIEVENTTNQELPSTGGMGTTVLYIVGGMLVILAGAYLFFSRKRTA